jgi:hypothetical protein
MTFRQAYSCAIRQTLERPAIIWRQPLEKSLTALLRDVVEVGVGAEPEVGAEAGVEACMAVPLRPKTFTTTTSMRRK